jgi:hypothetical protein
MSGVFSMASHWVLQYLPDVVRQEQTGCAHFSAISGAILFSSCGWTASRLSHHGAGASGGNDARALCGRREQIAAPTEDTDGR